MSNNSKIEWTIQIASRFWSYVQKGDSCWEWRGGRFADGMRYGQFRVGKKKLKAHRFAYMLTHGEIPDGMRVCHTCDNPICVKDEHHFLGTDADNSADRERKGRGVHNGTSLPGERNPAAKITMEIVRQIRADHASGVRTKRLSEQYGPCLSQILNIVNGRCWKDIS